MQDCRAEHLNLLSLLESPSDLDTSDDQENDLDNNFGKLKERLSRFIVYDCKPDFSRFLEYWVPVQISNVQLEQYCATLHSNYASLRSLLKKDPFGTLHSILISTRKVWFDVLVASVTCVCDLYVSFIELHVIYMLLDYLSSLCAS